MAEIRLSGGGTRTISSPPVVNPSRVVSPITGQTGIPATTYAPITAEQQRQEILTSDEYSGGYSAVGGGIGGTANPELNTSDSGGTYGGVGVEKPDPRPHRHNIPQPVVLPTPAPTPTPTPTPAPTQEEIRGVTNIEEKYAAYKPSTTQTINGKTYKTQAGYYTSEGKFYPSTSEDYIPKGYKKGKELSLGTDRSIVTSEDAELVSTKFGTAIKSGGQYTVVEPDEAAIKAEKQAYYAYAATQKSYKPVTVLSTFQDLSKQYKGYKAPTELQKAAGRVGETFTQISEAPSYIQRKLYAYEEPAFTYVLGERRGITSAVIGSRAAEFGAVILAWEPLVASAIIGGTGRTIAATTSQQRFSAIGQTAFTAGLAALPYLKPVKVIKPFVLNISSKVSAGTKSILATIPKIEEKVLAFKQAVAPVRTTTWGYLGKPRGVIIRETMAGFKSPILTPTQEVGLGYNIVKQELGYIASTYFYLWNGC